MSRAVSPRSVSNEKLVERFAVWERAFAKCDNARADVEQFGIQAVKALREIREWSQGDLAKALGTDRTYIVALENNRQALSRDMIRRIAALIDKT